MTVSESDELARAAEFRRQTVSRAAATVAREKQLLGDPAALNTLHLAWQPVRLAQLERSAGLADDCDEGPR